MRNMDAQHRQLARMERDALADCREDGRPDVCAMHAVTIVWPDGVMGFRAPNRTDGSPRYGYITADGSRVVFVKAATRADEARPEDYSHSFDIDVMNGY